MCVKRIHYSCWYYAKELMHKQSAAFGGAVQRDTRRYRKSSSSSKPWDKEGILVGLAEIFPLNTLLLTWLLTNLFFFFSSKVTSFLYKTPTTYWTNQTRIASLFCYLHNFDPGKMSQDVPQQNFSSKASSPQHPRRAWSLTHCPGARKGSPKEGE